MSFANRRGITHISSSRETRERGDEFDRRNVRNSVRDRSPIRGSEGSRPDYGGTRRSPRKSPRRFNRSPGRRSPAKRSSPVRRSPSRRSLGRRSPVRSPGRRSPPGHEVHSRSYRGGSTGADRSVFDQFRSLDDNKEKPAGANQNVPTLSAGSLASFRLHCELIVVILDSRQRSYVENICQRLSDIGLKSEIVSLRGDTTQNTVLDKVRDAADHNAVLACVINEQNVMHRSLTVYILHGQPQEHRNMPVESALGLITKTCRQFVAERENSAGRPPVHQQSNIGMTSGLAVDSQRSISPTFQRPDENITNMLKMVINGSNLVVEELDEIIGFFQQQRDRLASARGIALLKEEARSMQKTHLKPENMPVNLEEIHEKNDLEDERRELQEKIRGMLASDPSLYESVKGMLDPKTLSVIQSEMDQLSRSKQPFPNSGPLIGSLPVITGHKAEMPPLAYRFHDDKQPLAQSGKPVERKDVREQWPQERFQNSRQQPDGAANVRLPLDANLDLMRQERSYSNQQQQHISAANTTYQRTDTDMREPLGLNSNSRQREGIPESSFRGSGVQSYGKPVGAKNITQPDGTRMGSEGAPVAANQQVDIKELQERILGILQGKVLPSAINQSSKPDARTPISQTNNNSVPPYNNPGNITRADARTPVSQTNDSSVPPYNNPKNINRPDSASPFYAKPDEGPRPSASTTTPYGQSRELLSRNEPQNVANAFGHHHHHQQQQQQQPRDNSRPPLLIQQGDAGKPDTSTRFVPQLDTGRQDISSSLGQRRDDANSYQRRFELNPSQSEINRDQGRAEPDHHSSTLSQKPGLLGPGIPAQKRGLLGSAPDNGRLDNNSLMQSQYGNLQAPINRQPNAGFQGVRPVFPNQGNNRPSGQQRPGLLNPPPNWMPPVQQQQQQRFY